MRYTSITKIILSSCLLYGVSSVAYSAVSDSNFCSQQYVQLEDNPDPSLATSSQSCQKQRENLRDGIREKTFTNSFDSTDIKFSFLDNDTTKQEGREGANYSCNNEVVALYPNTIKNRAWLKRKKEMAGTTLYTYAKAKADLLDELNRSGANLSRLPIDLEVIHCQNDTNLKNVEDYKIGEKDYQINILMGVEGQLASKANSCPYLAGDSNVRFFDRNSYALFRDKALVTKNRGDTNQSFNIKKYEYGDIDKDETSDRFISQKDNYKNFFTNYAVNSEQNSKLYQPANIFDDYNRNGVVPLGCRKITDVLSEFKNSQLNLSNYCYVKNATQAAREECYYKLLKLINIQNQRGSILNNGR